MEFLRKGIQGSTPHFVTNNTMAIKTIFLVLLMAACQQSPSANNGTPVVPTQQSFINESTVIHVFVALCDNKYQGIVPVPAKIGNGQDPLNNLYWGAAYGIKSFFKKSTDWSIIQSQTNPANSILERCVFKHKSKNVFIVADAYDGATIKSCTIDFFNACAGLEKKKIIIKDKELGINGNAQLIAYIGHDGLMDFSLNSYPNAADSIKRDAIMLACISKSYFKEGIRASGANPLVWSTGLMSPEAYTLKAAIDGWLNKETDAQVRERAAAAYHQYQKCGMKGARNLLVSGY